MIEISDSKHWKQLNSEDMKFYINFIIIDGLTDWRLPKYEEIKELVLLFRGDSAIYVSNIWTIESWNSMDDSSYISFWMIPVRDSQSGE
jgi:hypothetical protein